MPKSKHDIMKRNLAQVYGHLDKAMTGLLEIEGIFREHHPEMADALKVCAEGCLASQQLMMRFWEKAWGNWPSNISSWL